MSLRKSKSPSVQPHVLISGEVLRQIRQHARSSIKTEVCGVLIGGVDANDANKIKIAACIAGLNAAQAGTHVTFTQDTWEHIYKIKDATFPEDRIVGWYHSHPGFVVFLSDHDTFIHKNFFSSPLQVAWVYDPHSDEEGCFGWIGSPLERLSEISVEDVKGGEGAGETGKPEPVAFADREEERENFPHPGLNATPVWVRRLSSVLTHVTLFIAGFLLAWFIGPRILIVPVDPRTGEQVGRPIDARELLRSAPERTAPPQNTANPPAANEKSSDLSGEKSGPKNKDPHAP